MFPSTQTSALPVGNAPAWWGRSVSLVDYWSSKSEPATQSLKPGALRLYPPLTVVQPIRLHGAARDLSTPPISSSTRRPAASV